MKLSVAIFIGTLAGSVSGFSITMSSYLDNLKPGGLQSFAPNGAAPAQQGYAPAPSYAAPPSYAPAPSYAPPAPAPPAYTSAFAHLPANSDLNYLATVGGGSQMKGGRNYSGVSSNYPTTYSTGNAAYLDDLKGAVMTSGWANGAAAPPPQGAVSNSYSSMQNSFAAAAQPSAPVNTASYLNSL